MTEGQNPPVAVDPDLIAALDIGTNSVRMSLVRLHEATQTWTVVSQHKETVRLGHNGFESGQLAPDATQRGVLVLQKFADIARGSGASEIIAIATAALREAENRDTFVQAAREQAGIEVRVVPGVEEARLIYLGVASGLHIGDTRALFVDIGGGSTELIVGTQTEHLFLESLKLGAIRVGNQFLTGLTGPIPPSVWNAMREHARFVSSHAVRHINEVGGFEIAVASSGTAMNLAQIAVRRAGQDISSLRNYELQTSDLREIAAMLCKLTLDERRRVPGLNPERADIIVSGAAVLLTLAEELNISAFRIAERSLREGVLVEAILRRQNANPTTEPAFEAGVRSRSIQKLGQFISREAVHARHVADLTLRLFDQTRTLGLHAYGPHERELLEYAALLHDVGVFISHSGHHRHSYYLIRHFELAGFSDEEIEIMANLAYFHRKASPKKRHAHFVGLPAPTQTLVRKLSCLIRIAEGLDRSHLGLVKSVTAAVSPAPNPTELKTVTLVLDAPLSDPRLELWQIATEREIWQEAFGTDLVVQVGYADAK